jgi:hypothetical protein
MSTPRLTEQQLLQVLPILSRNLHNIYVTEHAEQRMNERNITYDDVLTALHKPMQLVDVRYDEVFKGYKYKITGVDKNKEVVVAIDGVKRHIHIVTVINKLL